MKFKKALAGYYDRWLRNCEESIIYCENRGQMALANEYRHNAREYRELIADNNEAIEFFCQGDNAFLIDSALPEKFRGYE